MMLRKSFLKKCKNLLIFAFVLAIAALFFACDTKVNFIIGDKADIYEEIEKSHTTEITFYDENPLSNPSANSLLKRFAIGTDVDAASLFPSDLKPGYVATRWVYCDLNDESAQVPVNVYTENNSIKSVSVTLHPLCFYAESWNRDENAVTIIYHMIQNLDLETYTLKESEQKTGISGKPVSADDLKKDYAGFTYKSFTDEVVRDDGIGEMYVYYDRKEITITINSEAGTFADDSEAVSQKITGFYEAEVALPNLVKKNYKIVGFINDATSEEIEKIETFPADDASYTVHWEETNKEPYKVRYMLQKIMAAQPAEDDGEADGTIVSGGKTYYKVYAFAKEVTLYGYPDDKTDAQPATAELIPNIANYTIKVISESNILADGSTIVSVYYDVKPFDVVLQSNTGSGDVVSQTFYTETNCITIQSSASLPFTKKNSHIASWNTQADASGTTYDDEAAIEFTSEPAEQMTLYAQWDLNEATGDVTLNGKYTFVLKQGDGTADNVLQSGTAVSKNGNITSEKTLAFTLVDAEGNTVSAGGNFKIEIKQGGATVTSANSNSCTVPSWLAMPGTVYEVYMYAEISGTVYDFTIGGLSIL